MKREEKPVAFVVQGTKVNECTKETGPQGRELRGDGEKGLANHGEANRSVDERVRKIKKARKAVGFDDTEQVADAFERIHDTSQGNDPATAEDPAGDGDEGSGRGQPQPTRLASEVTANPPKRPKKNKGGAG